jgi:nucleoside-diphosphate-sugar epimerase
MTPDRGHWIDRPTLVTGATGLVGGWLTKALVDAGADVVCLVRDHDRTPSSPAPGSRTRCGSSAATCATRP